MSRMHRLPYPPLPETRMQSRILVALALLLALGAPAASRAGTAVTFGVSPGPYGDMVRKAIAPGLEKRGYTVTVKEFSDYVQPNLALANGSIDANLFQHSVYLAKFSADKGLKLSPVLSVPTAGAGLYSRRIQSLDQLKAGDELVVSNDPTNLARHLRFLQKVGLVKLRPDADPAKVSEKDVVENPKGLKIRPIEAAQAPRALDSVALVVVNGNFAIAAGIPLASAIATEQLDESLKNVVAVRTDDLAKPLARDIRAVLESPEFRAAIDDPKGQFKDFQKPAWMK